MTTLRVRWIKDWAMIARADFERLLQLARESDAIQIAMEGDDVPAGAIAEVAANGRAFDWLHEEPDLYSIDDLKVRYR